MSRKGSKGKSKGGGFEIDSSAMEDDSNISMSESQRERALDKYGASLPRRSTMSNNGSKRKSKGGGFEIDSSAMDDDSNISMSESQRERALEKYGASLPRRSPRSNKASKGKSKGGFEIDSSAMDDDSNISMSESYRERALEKYGASLPRRSAGSNKGSKAKSKGAGFEIDSSAMDDDSNISMSESQRERALEKYGTSLPRRSTMSKNGSKTKSKDDGSKRAQLETPAPPPPPAMDKPQAKKRGRPGPGTEYLKLTKVLDVDDDWTPTSSKKVKKSQTDGRLTACSSPDESDSPPPSVHKSRIRPRTRPQTSLSQSSIRPAEIYSEFITRPSILTGSQQSNSSNASTATTSRLYKRRRVSSALTSTGTGTKSGTGTGGGIHSQPLLFGTSEEDGSRGSQSRPDSDAELPSPIAKPTPVRESIRVIDPTQESIPDSGAELPSPIVKSIRVVEATQDSDEEESISEIGIDDEGRAAAGMNMPDRPTNTATATGILTGTRTKIIPYSLGSSISGSDNEDEDQGHGQSHVEIIPNTGTQEIFPDTQEQGQEDMDDEGEDNSQQSLVPPSPEVFDEDRDDSSGGGFSDREVISESEEDADDENEEEIENTQGSIASTTTSRSRTLNNTNTAEDDEKEYCKIGDVKKLVNLRGPHWKKFSFAELRNYQNKFEEDVREIYEEAEEKTGREDGVFTYRAFESVLKDRGLIGPTKNALYCRMAARMLPKDFHSSKGIIIPEDDQYDTFPGKGGLCDPATATAANVDEDSSESD